MDNTKALTTIIEGVYAAQRRGVYSLQEAGVLAKAVSVFIEDPNNKPASQNKEEKDDNGQN